MVYFWPETALSTVIVPFPAAVSSAKAVADRPRVSTRAKRSARMRVVFFMLFTPVFLIYLFISGGTPLFYGNQERGSLRLLAAKSVRLAAMSRMPSAVKPAVPLPPVRGSSA
mgnify:CR=1 FL=1